MILQPFTLRDFRNGVYRKAAINSAIVPPNSVSNAVNVNFDTIIGSGVVRPGTTLLGGVVAANKTPLGLDEFVTSGGTLNLPLAVFSGASTATIYYFDTSWHASTLSTLSNTSKVRFAQIGNYAFMANGVDAMKSSADGNTWGTNSCITTDSVIPSLVFRSKQRLLAAGYSGYRDRVYFSSIISPAATPAFLTWNTNTTTGDWIDINPDDGSNITGFAETSNTTLVFKAQGMYRLDVISKTVDSTNIFNIGAVSQESIVECLGSVYFFSGYDIRQTTGDFPIQISRLGVQDFLDAIPQANWASVAAGTDGLNVYFSCGNVTVGFTTYNNLVLKYSPRDQNWSVHSYAQLPRFFCQYTSSTNGRKMIGADTGGNVQTYNVGTTDNTTAINFLLETQELEFGNRAHVNNINDKLVIFTKYGLNSRIDVSQDDDDYIPARGSLGDRVNILSDLNITGSYITLKWSGTSTQKAPVFEGFYVEEIQDDGITGK